MIGNFKQWEIWSTEIKYEETQNSKIRPVLILDSFQDNVKCAKITSQRKRENYPGEIQINEWKKAGLRKPSVIRLSQLYVLPKVKMNRFIGVLQPNDAYIVLEFIEENGKRR